MSDEPKPTPESRAKDGFQGIPVLFGDGETWVIPRFGLAKGLASLRDEVYESSLAKRSVLYSNIKAAAYYGLAINYDLADDEIRAILDATDPGSIADAICEALIPIEVSHRTFSAWARASLLANGLAPSEVPPDDLPHVLEILVATGRTVSALNYTDVGRGVKTRRNLLSRLATD